MSQAPIVFELKDLTVSFQGRPALHHFSATFRQGEMWAVLGPNGSGKSTLLRVLSGELKSYEGQLRRPDFLTTLDTDRIAYLGQTPLMNQDLPVTVKDVVSQGLISDMPWGFWPQSAEFKRERLQKIEKALTVMDLMPLQNEIWTHLSGGQRQRALIARLWVQDADILLLDEPTNSLDEASQKRLLEELTRLHRSGKTVICVMHDEVLARKYFSQSLSLGPTDCPVMPTKSQSANEVRA